MDGDDVTCDRCRAQRALVHCAEDAARLCLPCDVAAHASATAVAHERAPLCDGCHAAPAVARCDDGALCAACACAVAAACVALRPAGAYTGFPEVAELARILAVDGYDDVQATAAKLPSASLAATQNDNTGDIITRAAAASDDVFAGGLPSWSELAMAASAADAHLLSDQLSSMSTGAAMLEFPGVSMPMMSPPPGGYQDEVSAPEKVEATMSRQRKRQRAMQRYNDKKKKRRFGCREIMYESRKATADTRQRVKGRFAKAAAAADSSTTSGVRAGDVTGLPIQ